MLLMTTLTVFSNTTTVVNTTVLPNSRFEFLHEIRTWYCHIIPRSFLAESWQCSLKNTDAESKRVIRIEHHNDLKAEMKGAKLEFCTDGNVTHSPNSNVRCKRYNESHANLNATNLNSTN